MKKLRNPATCMPFVIATMVLSFLIMAEILSTVALRIGGDILPTVSFQLHNVVRLFYAIEIGLRLAAFLLLVNQRGKLLHKARNMVIGPIVSHSAKRMLDWTLVVIGCLVLTSMDNNRLQ